METILQHILDRKLKSADAMRLGMTTRNPIVVARNGENRDWYEEVFTNTSSSDRTPILGDSLISLRESSGKNRSVNFASGAFGSPRSIELLVVWERAATSDREADLEWLKANWNSLASLISACRDKEKAETTPADSIGFSAGEEDRVVADVTYLFETTLLKRWVNDKADKTWDNCGSRTFRSQVRKWVSRNLPILFVLPAFPFKSGNTRAKVLGPLPDMGEKLGLERLDAFLRSVKSIYTPGATLAIFTDGRIYCDLFRISDRATSEFKKAIRQLCPKISTLQWADLDEYFPRCSDDEKRAALLNLFGSRPDEILARIKRDVDFEEVYKGFKKFMREELSFPIEWSNARQKRECGKIGKLLVQRTDAYQALIRSLFPDHVRLSIHPSTSVTKFSVDLVGKTDWGTPWHNCALLQPDGSWSLIRRATAESRRFPLARSDEGLPYFVNTSGQIFKERL